MNDRGDFVGAGVTSSGTFESVSYTGGRLRRLPALPGGTAFTSDPSNAAAINDNGDIVGASVGADGFLRAVLFRGDRAIDLNTLIPPNSDVMLGAANDINDLGQITGVAWKDGQAGGFLLTPNTIYLPEPAAMALTTLPLAVAATYIRRGRRTAA